ncbi:MULTISPECIES: uroporphyrinogen-III C-methyltransferase [Archaeoglobus]|jgi:uroporphyrin-III C-methyltransferase|uniref:uroporphyrinogen-III C-methyltransferase n=3 Tax=Archaeoglobus fulgidus TaxID=2234 RepID=O29025_ARCFU|nr:MULTISPECIES: uroporphyrinogen-III C-methyltransferase [Archaeoglobus]AAB89999.1 uroporphyrin-III C-methyltransferase (cysG-2) [Archaeoglobus fulgidus DSM 4304]AIG98114.1 uroporphyrin-III C-methyltransferase [Archaeoglobus fulgidus DSM 8774]KUJ93124.1 MAG: Uroporphyrin-III C-methyltransferase (CysG-2) [Archaeoglobus fulgidus]KUK06202.1 MAG: Uroporphyrin-III C-methyltransferase (CysG-2) [Archaeoglobus fulgidus]MDI3498752.1 uroporphyrin-III C-methyltransferase [Archaeoglobus sp.]
MVGKVYIVGAGPGKKDLLTLRAYELIKRADVILHDELIGEVAELLKESRAEIVDVGKRSGRHKKRQEEINKLLVEYARQGKTVVRLKGGDPCVFGRGGEEAEFLAKHGIPFEFVPGVTSAIAVPEAVGIPVTHRRYDPALVFITGRESRERLNWKALAELNATIVILMGVSRIPEIAKNLLEHGKDPETEVAIIESGFSDRERVILTTLGKMAERAEKERVKPPAIIVIGKVVELYGVLSRWLG